MIRQKYKQEMFAKPVAPRPEEPLTSLAKNIMTHLNDQNLRQAATNDHNSKTPGLHLSSTRGDRALGQLAPAMPPQESAAQRDSLLLRSPLLDSEREAENLPPRRPLKLAPLELPKEVREAQRKKIKGIQLEAKAATCKLDTAGNEPCPRNVTACVREAVVKSPECPPMSVQTDPMKGHSQQHRAAKALQRPASEVQKNRYRLPGDAASKAAPPAVSSKPALSSMTLSVKTQATHSGERAFQKPGPFQQDTGKRRLRLKRVECLEEDQSKPNMSTEGSSAEEGKVAHGGRSKGQRAERALREASRMLEKASGRSSESPQQSGNVEVAGGTVRRMAVSNLQDAVI